MSKNKRILNVKFEHWDWECGEEGCCYEDGISMSVNGNEVTRHIDTPQGVIDLLQYLGYEVNTIN